MVHSESREDLAMNARALGDHGKRLAAAAMLRRKLRLFRIRIGLT